MVWTVEFSRNALKEAKKLRSANLASNVNRLIEILKENPYKPPYEKLSGNLQGYYSRRIIENNQEHYQNCDSYFGGTLVNITFQCNNADSYSLMSEYSNQSFF